MLISRGWMEYTRYAQIVEYYAKLKEIRTISLYFYGAIAKIYC